MTSRLAVNSSRGGRGKLCTLSLALAAMTTDESEKEVFGEDGRVYTKMYDDILPFDFLFGTRAGGQTDAYGRFFKLFNNLYLPALQDRHRRRLSTSLNLHKSKCMPSNPIELQ